MPYRSVVITGASSGIGAALALESAHPDVTLHLSGRNAARLEAVAEKCCRLGATVLPRLLDVTDAPGMADWIGGLGPIDLLVANAGIASDVNMTLAVESPEQVRQLFAVNLTGVLNTVLPALPVMTAQPRGPDSVRGRIAVIASVGAFIAYPTAPSYSASKAAVDAWTVASAASLRRQGIVMCSVCPGFVRSAITAAIDLPMPGLMDADRAARLILSGVAKDRRRIAFPWWVATMTRLVGLLPPRLLSVGLPRDPIG
jgi:short-subunit dehydrogenase